MIENLDNVADLDARSRIAHVSEKKVFGLKTMSYFVTFTAEFALGDHKADAERLVLKLKTVGLSADSCAVAAVRDLGNMRLLDKRARQTARKRICMKKSDYSLLAIGAKQFFVPGGIQMVEISCGAWDFYASDACEIDEFDYMPPLIPTPDTLMWHLSDDLAWQEWTELLARGLPFRVGDPTSGLECANGVSTLRLPALARRQASLGTKWFAKRDTRLRSSLLTDE